MYRSDRGFSFRYAVVVVAVCLTVLVSGCFPPLDEEIALDGTWSGAGNHTYLCESEPSVVAFSIVGDSITLSGGDVIEYLFPENMTGTLVEQSPGRYSVTFDHEEGLPGLLIVDAGGTYGLLVMDAEAYGEGNRSGFVAVLQKAPLSEVEFSEEDLLGTWAGVTARVNASFQVTESTESSAVISNPDGLALEGEDGEGAFAAEPPGIVLVTYFDSSSSPGIYGSGGGANQVIWPDADVARDAIYALSTDKTVVAVAFLTDACDLSIFNDLPAQRFALWARE